MNYFSNRKILFRPGQSIFFCNLKLHTARSYAYATREKYCFNTRVWAPVPPISLSWCPFLKAPENWEENILFINKEFSFYSFKNNFANSFIKELISIGKKKKHLHFKLGTEISNVIRMFTLDCFRVNGEKYSVLENSSSTTRVWPNLYENQFLKHSLYQDNISLEVTSVLSLTGLFGNNFYKLPVIVGNKAQTSLSGIDEYICIDQDNCLMRLS